MKQMRIVGLGDYHDYYSAFTYGILEGAIRCGAWFRPVPLFGQSLSAVESQINFFQPHLILCHMIFNRQPHNRDDVFEMLRRLKSKGIIIAYHAGDARKIPRYEGDISSFVDFCLMNHGMMEQFSNIWRVPCFYWPYACLYQEGVSDVDKRFKCKIAFTGALSDEPGSVHYDRSVFIRRLMDKGLVKLFPTPETGNTRFLTAELSSSADSVLGIGMAEDIPQYLDVRPFQYIGAGAIYLHNRSNAMRKMFQPDVHYIEYEPLDTTSLLFQIERHSKISHNMRQLGFEFAQKYHSTKERMQFVLDLIDGKEVQYPYLENLWWKQS